MLRCGLPWQQYSLSQYCVFSLSLIITRVTLRLVKYRLSHISADREPLLQPPKCMMPYLQPPCDTSFTVKTRSHAESAYGEVRHSDGGYGDFMTLVMHRFICRGWKQRQELTTMRRKLSVFGLLESALCTSSLCRFISLTFTSWTSLRNKTEWSQCAHTHRNTLPWSLNGVAIHTLKRFSEMLKMKPGALTVYEGFKHPAEHTKHEVTLRRKLTESKMHFRIYSYNSLKAARKYWWFRLIHNIFKGFIFPLILPKETSFSWQAEMFGSIRRKKLRGEYPLKRAHVWMRSVFCTVRRCIRVKALTRFYRWQNEDGIYKLESELIFVTVWRSEFQHLIMS